MCTHLTWRFLAAFVGGVMGPITLLAAESAKPPLPLPMPPRAPLQSVTVFPSQVLLDGPRDRQQLLVLGTYADGQQWDLTRQAVFTSSSTQVASVDAGGVLHPVSDGSTMITVHAGDKTATVATIVQRAKLDIPVAFAREIVPMLTKLGCNQGACHGSQHGKNGFRLSLLGYDPTFDYTQIVQSAEGRRVVVSDPERSILLLKPSLTMEHGGGERFRVSSPPYNLLKQWLEDGAPEPPADPPTVTGLEVWPAKRIMVPGEQQQLSVRATWNGGRKEDVTATARYDALSEAVASVTPSGLITARGRGETHIMIRFAGQASVVQVTLPYHPPQPSTEVAKFNFIDDKLSTKWHELGLTPSPLCSDAEFFRRIHLDAIGTLPTPEEIRAFLADTRADKRHRAIDSVLERPEFVDFWALKWGDLLRVNRDQLNEKGMWSFDNWIRAALRDNQPIDEFVRDIITAEGSTYSEGPANFYRTANNAADWAETTSQLFLGVRMQCAKCHHHPFEKWSQDDYYGLAAFFVRLATKRSEEFGIFGQERVIYLRSNGEQRNPRTGKVVKPHPLDGPVMEDPFDRRRKLAEWVTAPSNPFFARNIVNRFWGYYMGRGLVEPLDDLRATNPPSDPELLDALAQDFVAHHFDLKQLMRTIMNSRAYQLSSAETPGNEADTGNVYGARYTVKRLSAEQLADAIDFATGTHEKYQGLPLGTRAIQLPDTSVRSFMLDVFGRPPRQITCECERKVQPNIAQALHLLNGDALNKKLTVSSGRIGKLIEKKTPLPAIVEDLYLATLSRPPRADEAAEAAAWIAKAPNQKEGVQDLLWVLLNSREFLFNH
jgi:hypothetical protein